MFKLLCEEEALKLMLDGKKVLYISEDERKIYYIDFNDNFSIKVCDVKRNSVYKITIDEFIVKEYKSLFSEYIETKPRKFEFEGSIVEITNRSIKFDYNNDKYIEKLAKCCRNKLNFKITIEEILE